MPEVLEAENVIAREVFPLSVMATFQLARGTCVPIATLLTLPDLVALIPTSHSFLSWGLNVLAIWLTCAVIWFLGFTCILQAVRIIVGGVELNARGIRLWRFARWIEWNKLHAVECEPQIFFTRLFTLPDPAQRLTLFEEKKNLKKDGAPYLVPHYLPSFFFDHKVFNRLFSHIVQEKFAMPMQTTYALAASADDFPRLRRVHGKMRAMRFLLPCLIAFGLVMLLGRKAGGNFEVNCGNQSMLALNYEEARQHFQRATAIDPAFPAAWDYLGNAEFELGETNLAREHWERALFLKPDFVEAKVSLAYLKLHERNFAQALELLNSALRLHPFNPYALINRADCDMHQGHYFEAIEDARMVFSQDQDPRSNLRYMAVCLMSEGKAKTGHPADALRMLDLQAPTEPSKARGCNLSFRWLVTSEVLRALDRPADAKKAIDAGLKLSPKSPSLVLENARVLVALKRYHLAMLALDAARLLEPHDPWPWLIEANMYETMGKAELARQSLASALGKPVQDAESLAQSARLTLEFGDANEAVKLAQESLVMEPNCRDASIVMHDAHDALSKPEAKSEGKTDATTEPKSEN